MINFVFVNNIIIYALHMCAPLSLSPLDAIQMTSESS